MVAGAGDTLFAAHDLGAMIVTVNRGSAKWLHAVVNASSSTVPLMITTRGTWALPSLVKIVLRLQ
ncbi:hypothetical protein GCM10027067_18950 [Pseudactinotalea suaedae]